MKLHIPVYSSALLLSAALVFTVQPMFTKMVLPLLGGTPQVWNTSMLFFQVCLLGGYAYAHATTRFFSVRVQACLHILLLAAFAIILPFAIPDTMYPSDTDNPTIWQLSTMLFVLGGPFLIISGSAPMLQRWFATSNHSSADNPYFLYGASNLGSMSALLLYPILIEPALAISEQTHFWKVGYIALIGFSALCLSIVWNNKEKQSDHTSPEDQEHITAARRIKWVILSFLPASLMLGVTTHITTDIASAPLLWVLPLAFYIGTFIIVFARKPILDSKQASLISGIFIILLVLEVLLPNLVTKTNPLMIVALHLLAVFFATLVCHSELANAKPRASHLTEFYLIMSFGGALGGFTNSIIAPNFFTVPIEYPLILALTVFVRYSGNQEHHLNNIKEKILKNPNNIFNTNTAILVLAACAFGYAAPNIGDTKIRIITTLLAVSPLIFVLKSRWAFPFFATFIMLIPVISGPKAENTNKTLHKSRNFFGVMTVLESDKKRLLLHGTTVHGEQLINKGHRLIQTAYYSKSSPLADIFDILDRSKTTKQKVAVLGLGVGVTACYQAPNRTYDFYEIDKAVVDMAENQEYFTFLSDCGSPYKIILGDGRIKVSEQPEQIYDLIVVDVFSSDNIPVHLITKEAIKTYLEKLTPDGILTIHISNRYLDLEPQLAAISHDLGLTAYAKVGKGIELEDTGITSHPAHYVSFTKNTPAIDYLRSTDWNIARSKEGLKPWTDQYSDIISAFKSLSLSDFIKNLTPQSDKEKDQ